MKIFAIIVITIVVAVIFMFGVSIEVYDDTSELQTVTYEGHDFILYDGDAYAGGIVHHPSCKNSKCNP